MVFIMQRVVLGGGCFWSSEAVFQHLNGVKQVICGYMGGTLQHPTSMEISNGDTGHAEVVQIDFDENQISFHQLLKIFFSIHNPTILNRKINDVASQHRSVVFYQNEEQKIQTERMIEDLTSTGFYDREILTEVSPSSEFYDAEDYHQNYYKNNPAKPYCAVVIQPKLDKLTREFKENIKFEQLIN